MRYSAALLGYYGFGNLGDELLLSSTISILERCGVNRDKIIVFSNNPELTSSGFSVKSINRWSWNGVFTALKSSDRLILGGGGIFQDSTSIKSCLWYWGVIRLANFLGVKIFAIGQSVGPLKTKISRFLAADALKLCGKIHVRGAKSLREAENLGCRNISCGTDLVFTLKNDGVISRGNLKLLNVRPCRNLDSFKKILIPHIDDYTVGVALSHEDENVIKSLGLREIFRVRNFDDAKKIWSEAKSAVGMRLHFGILSQIFRTPLAMMPYDIKINEFAESSGVPLIADDWAVPVMPREIPESSKEIDILCREILAL